MPLVHDKAEMMGWLAEVIQDGLKAHGLTPPFLDADPVEVKAEVDPTGYVVVTIGDVVFYVDIVSKFK